MKRYIPLIAFWILFPTLIIPPSLMTAEITIAQENVTAEQWVEKGSQLKKLERYDEALTAFDRAIKIQPNFAPVFVEKSDVLNKLRRWDEALLAANKAIALAPENAKAYRIRGTIYNNQGKTELALADENKAIELAPDSDPDRWLSYAIRGHIYLELRKSELALADFNQLIDINPNFPIGYSSLGHAYKQMGNIEAARSNYQKAQQLAIARGETAFARQMANLLKQLP